MNWAYLIKRNNALFHIFIFAWFSFKLMKKSYIMSNIFWWNRNKKIEITNFMLYLQVWIYPGKFDENTFHFFLSFLTIFNEVLIHQDGNCFLKFYQVEELFWCNNLFYIRKILSLWLAENDQQYIIRILLFFLQCNFFELLCFFLYNCVNLFNILFKYLACFNDNV